MLITLTMLATAMQPTIPVTVRVAVPESPLIVGEPLPLTITVENGLAGPIEYHTYAIEPVDWNGEAVGLTLEDVYREGAEGNRYLAAPKAEVPRVIAGTRRHVIESGKSLTIRIDASKWELRDGWKAGTYSVNVRVSVWADENRCQLRVLSEPIEFAIVEKR